MQVIDIKLLRNKITAMQACEPKYAYNFLNDAQNLSTEWDCVEDMIDSIPVVEAEPVRQGKWISTKEKMPENIKTVLICACGHIATAYYNHLKKAFILTENENLHYETSAVSHWMPLPEPPEGECGWVDDDSLPNEDMIPDNELICGW